MKRCIVAMAFVTALLFTMAPARASEPGWWGHVFARGHDRIVVESTPIVHRPYRPLHFYGNTIRRSYYRGDPMPRPRDFLLGSGSLIFRR